MYIGTKTQTAISSIATTGSMMFLQDTIKTLIPWIFTFTVIILADLIAGLWKSAKLGVHISWSKAGRETMGKFVVYLSFVLAVAMIDSASNHSFSIAKWCCLFVGGLELVSIVGNILKTKGIEISPVEIFKILLKRSPLNASDEEAGSLAKENKLEEIKQRERKRWEGRK